MAQDSFTVTATQAVEKTVAAVVDHGRDRGSRSRGEVIPRSDRVDDSVHVATARIGDSLPPSMRTVYGRVPGAKSATRSARPTVIVADGAAVGVGRLSPCG